MTERSLFPRTARVRRHGDFVRVQRAPDLRVREKAFLLLARFDLPGPESATSSPRSTCRLGLVASRKLGGAVERNRGKRIVREVFRRWRMRLPADLDLVVVLHPPILAHTATTLEREFARAVDRLLRDRERARRPRATEDAP